MLDPAVDPIGVIKAFCDIGIVRVVADNCTGAAPDPNRTNGGDVGLIH